jgi:hypothetical protein
MPASSSAASSAFSQKARFFRFCAACMSVCCGKACKHCSSKGPIVCWCCIATVPVGKASLSENGHEHPDCTPGSFRLCAHHRHSLAGTPLGGSSAAARDCHCDLRTPLGAPAACWAVAAVHQDGFVRCVTAKCLALVQLPTELQNCSTWLEGVTAGVLAMRCGTAAELSGCEAEGGPAEDGGAMLPAICITDPTSALPCIQDRTRYSKRQCPQSGCILRSGDEQDFENLHDALQWEFFCRLNTCTSDALHTESNLTMWMSLGSSQQAS